MRGNLLRRHEAVLHADGDVSSLDERGAFLLIGVGDVEVGAQGEDPLLGRHLQHQICVVRSAINLARAGRPRMAWYAMLKSATRKLT